MQLDRTGSRLCSSSPHASRCVQAKYRDVCQSNAEEIRQLNQDLKTAADMLCSHRQGITATLEGAISRVRAVHAEVVAS